MAAERTSCNLKIVLCGNPNVGKKALISRWTNKGSSFGSTGELRGIKVGGRHVSLTLKAIKAEDTFNSGSAASNKSFFSDIDAFVFVYDVTDQKSLSVMSFWMELLAKRIGDAAFPVSFLIGNKIDEEEGDHSIPVKPKTVRKFFANELRLRAFHRVSAKTGENVDAALQHLIMCCVVSEADPEKLQYLIPNFMIQALGKINSKVRLKYENKSFSPFSGSLDDFEQQSLVSPQSFIRSRIADDLPSLLNSSRFLAILKLAVQTNTLPVAKVALKCFQKLLSLGYLENCTSAAEEWVEAIATHHQLMDSKYQDLVINTLFTMLVSLRGYQHGIFLKAFGICYHICVIGDQEQFDEILMKILNGALLHEESKIANLLPMKRSRPVNLFSVTEVGEEKRGLEAVLAYLDYESDDQQEQSTSLESQSLFSEVENTAAKLLEAVCWLSTGYNKFVKVKGLPQYKHQSKYLFLKLVTRLLRDFDVAKQMFVINRDCFSMALTESGISCNLDLFERLISFTLTVIGKTGVTSSRRSVFREEIAVLLEVFLFLCESQNVPVEHKALVRKFVAELTANNRILLEVYMAFDCSLYYPDLFEKLTSLIAHFFNNAHTPPTREEEAAVRKDCLKNIVSLLKFLSAHSRKKLSRPLSEISDEIAAIKSRKIALQNGIESFNTCPAKGMQFLQDNEFVGTAPVEIAGFLRNDCRFERMAIGEYLGDPGPDCVAVMKAFIDSFDFSNLDFLMSLRKIFLRGFRLPGESQKIDRIMEKFAARYCECNPKQSIIASVSAAHTLAFSIIMLNTDLHAPNIKQHMTSEEFIKNNRGINDSQDFPKEFLQNLYNKVSKEKLLVSFSLSEIVRQSATILNSNANNRSSGGRLSQHVVQLSFETHMELVKLAADEMLRIAYSRRETSSAVLMAMPRKTCAIKSMFETVWSIFQPVFRYGLESGDDEMAGLCIDGLYTSILLANDFNLIEIYDACTAILSGFTDKIAATALSESMLNMIATIGGRDFINSFLRSSV